VLNVEKTYLKVVLLDKTYNILPGFKVIQKNVLAGVKLSYTLLGRVIDSLGHFIDGKPNIFKSNFVRFKRIDVKAPGIVQRSKVCEPVYTGLLVIDSMIPVGRGQRELIIGDRQTGKTTIAIDTILTQSKINNTIDGYGVFSGLFCIYVAIGQRKSAVSRI
jgi:F0F1-type ATP synthase alpha subunit